MSAGWRAAVRRSRLLARARLARFNWLARTGAHQDFSVFLKPEAEWREALAGAQGKRVLMATNTGGHFALAGVDRLLAVALTLRGAAVTSVLCDRALPACQMCEFALTPDVGAFARSGPDKLLCGYCHAPAAARLDAIGLRQARLSEALSAKDRAEARALAQSSDVGGVGALHWRGLPIGEHALAGALRFFARGDLADEPQGAAVLRAYVEAAALSGAAYLNLIDRIAPEVLVAHHGLYAPQGLASAAARARGVRVVTWNPAYRRSCFIFSHEDTYHRTLMHEAWAPRALSDAEAAQTRAYLHSRRAGADDWIRFNQSASALNSLADIGLDPAKPLALALTNVFWDAQLHYPANAFADQLAWLKATIDAVAPRGDLQLAIRVHPAEVTGSPVSRQRAGDALAALYPSLPPHIKIVPPESVVSSYALADLADVALIYGTKMGVELSALGLPVIVAGEAWVRGKGFTDDAGSADEYVAALAALPRRARLSPEMQARALSYAHHFFFGRMIELPFVQPAGGARRFTIAAQSLDDLRPGAAHGLDLICDGILEGTPFVA